MLQKKVAQATVVPFVRERHEKKKYRKFSINLNRDGSVRNINGQVYVDFMYLGKRVRECSGLQWTEQNAKSVRQQLDRIIVAINAGTFRYAEVFSKSKRKACFSEKERQLFGLQKRPDEVKLGDYIQSWYNRLKASQKVTGRTLFGYKSYIDCYLTPFFKDLAFSDLNVITFERFIAWAHSQKLKDKAISNTTINKILIPMKTICKDAAVEFNWGNNYDPFFGYNKLKEADPYEKISPCSPDEQHQIIFNMPDHWKPYFSFAFCCGLRHGEQIAIKPEDIDWDHALLKIRRAITLDEDGNTIEGTTKNKYSRRTIKLSPRMLEILKTQKAIHESLSSEYFFCSAEGKLISLDNLRNRVWKPALEAANIPYRDLKQTRHTFATTALSHGVNPLLVSTIMGHRNMEMINKVYVKYVENNTDSSHMEILDNVFRGDK